MPTNTYVPLATITLPGSATLVTFGSIPNSYRDLILTYRWTGTAAGDYIYVNFNNDTNTANYSRVQGAEFNGAVSNFGGTGQAGVYLNALPGSGGGMGVLQIQDYSSTDRDKTTLGRHQVSNGTVMIASRWDSTAAVYEIDLVVSGGGSISAGSIFSLYGIEG